MECPFPTFARVGLNIWYFRSHLRGKGAPPLMRVLPPPLLPLLRSRIQGSLLALTYLHPEREYSVTEAAKDARATFKAVQHEVTRLVDSGLLADRKMGNLRLIRSAPTSVLTRPLTDLLAVTYGPLPILTELLSSVDGVELAFIYGSWAARYEGEPGPIPRDIDVLVVGTADLDDLDDAAHKAQVRLGRAVDIRRVLPNTWEETDPGDPFLSSVHSRPLVELAIKPGGEELE
jgi:predicted nucleotidyltransferase